MPTILINTNINTNLNEDDVNKSLDDDFRQDLNTIITKLLNKSKTLDSFMIKYDIDDLIVNKSLNDNKTTNSNKEKYCICNRMASLFNDLLINKENCFDKKQIENELKSHHQNDNIQDPNESDIEGFNKKTSINKNQELKHIYKELKLLRKYQFDLTSKFNILLNKLDNNSDKKNTSPTQLDNSNNLKIKQEKFKNLLTGAKKRKFNKNTISNNFNQDDFDLDNEYDINQKSPTRSTSASSSSSRSATSSSTNTLTTNSDNKEKNNQNHYSDQENDSIIFNNNKNINIGNNNNNNNNTNNIDSNNNNNDLNDDLDYNNEEIDDSDYIEQMNDEDQNELGSSFNQQLNQQNHQLKKTFLNFKSSKPYLTITRQQQQQLFCNNLNHFNNNFANFQNRLLIPQSTPQFQKYTQIAEQNRLLSSTPQSSSSSSTSQQTFDSKLPLINPKLTSPTCDQQQQQQQQKQQNLSFDIDLNDLFKGNGPKYLQLESYKNFKPPIVQINEKYYVDDTMASLSYSKSKSRRNFAAHLTKLVFTPRERLESNCNGRFGKKALDSTRLLAIRNTIFKYYPCKQSTVILNGDKITSGDHDENSVWVRDCIPAIDESNRVLKKQLVAWYKKNNPDKLIRNGVSGGGGGGFNSCSNNSSSSIGLSNYVKYDNSNSLNNSSNFCLNNANGNLDEQDYEDLDEHE